MAGTSLDSLPRISVASLDDVRSWLAANGGRSDAVWLVTWKKSGTHPERHVPYAEVVDELLCHGWIDSRPGKLDADRSMLLIAPRRPGSAWSAINKAKVERLVAAGRMTTAGLAAVERARADGSWTRIDAAGTLAVPDDLAAALAAEPAADAAWQGFAPSSRRAILEWILQARRPQTRANRVVETVRLAAVGVRANHPADRGKLPDGGA